MRRIFGWVLSLIVILAVGLPVQAQAAFSNRLSPGVRRLMAGGLAAEARVVVLVRLNEQVAPAQVQAQPGQPGGRAQSVITALKSRAARAQVALLADLFTAQARGEAGRVTPLWIIDAVRVEAGPVLLSALAQRPDVAEVTLDADPANPIVPVGNSDRLTLAAGAPEPNLGVVGAPTLWAGGLRGQGVTVAVLDSGVDGTQPDLAARYRGGTHSWYDPYGEFVNPTDNAGPLYTGHGTGVTGIVLGDGTGNGTVSRSTGVAPGAVWIAAKIFNSTGAAVLTSVHQAFQWVLDPDGDPATADAPQVVNNSWAFNNPGACDLEFEPDIAALNAAGISVVFAAGNSGPNGATSVSPANNPGVIAVGAVDNSGAIASYSARGGNACAPAQVFPSLVAPGVAVITTQPGAQYLAEDGTSFAAPHVSGGLALLLSAYPHLTPAEQAAALNAGASDLGAPGPDDNFGYGLLNLPASRAAISNLLPKAFVPLFTTSPLPRIYLPMVKN